MKPLLLTLIGTLTALAFTDPPRLSYSTWIPGGGDAYTAIDGSGAQYFSGEAKSPCRLPSGVSAPAEGVYGLIGKLQPRGDGLAWTVCLPGAIRGLKVDAVGAVYVATQTNGAAVLTKLAPDASRAVYSTWIPLADARASAVDRGGGVYVGGVASAGFAPTQGAYQSVCSSTSDCGFVAKLGQTGAIEYATYTGTGAVTAIGVNSHGEVWITGSLQVSVPTQYSFQDSVIAKFSPDGGQRPFSMSFGGGIYFHAPISASGYGIAVDVKDSVYAVGKAHVPLSYTFLPVPIPQQGNLLFSTFAYIMKLSPAGDVIYNVFVGDSGFRIDLIAADGAGNAYLPLNGARYMRDSSCSYSGRGSTPLVILSEDGSRVLSSASVPGGVSALSQDEKGGVYVTGGAFTGAFVATPGAYQEQLVPGSPGGRFAAKLDFAKSAEPSVACLVNAASGWAGRNSYDFTGAVAPGEIVTLFGTGFRPGPDLRVTFDDRPAPILYSDTGQINSVVPFKAGENGASVTVSVKQGDQVIGSDRLPVSPAVPGIFGTLNEDWSVNSKNTPAAPGSVIAVFLTGAGAYNTAIDDGSMGPTAPPYPVPAIGVSVRFGQAHDQPGEVLFVSQAPGLMAGAVQLNLRVPAALQPGGVPLTVYFGNYPSHPVNVYVGSK